MVPDVARVYFLSKFKIDINDTNWSVLMSVVVRWVDSSMGGEYVMGREQEKGALAVEVMSCSLSLDLDSYSEQSHGPGLPNERRDHSSDPRCTPCC